MIKHLRAPCPDRTHPGCARYLAYCDVHGSNYQLDKLAAALTDEELAGNLEAVEQHYNGFTPSEKAALLRAAVRRLRA